MANIRTYARIKPTKEPYEGLDTTDNRVYLRVSEQNLQNKSGKPQINSGSHQYQFKHVFNAKVTQQGVFDGVAKEIITG